jgi:CHAT domain-containing protein/tetratricopeptide (TPR) repeat protein
MLAGPEAVYRSIEQKFIAGNLAAALADSERVAEQGRSFGSGWDKRFQLQRARILVYQGRSQDAIALLGAEPSATAPDRTFAISRGTLRSIALRRTGDKAGAEAELAAAESLCGDESACREVRLAQGIVALEGSQLAEAEHDFELSRNAARSSGDAFLEMQALLDLGTVELRREHYDTALERFAAASTVARSLGAGVAIEKATGNVGWALLKLGDYRRALENSRSAYEQAAKLGVPIDEVEWLNDAGLSQYRLGDLTSARDSFEHSLRLARSIHNPEETSSALVALATLSLDTGDLDGALECATQAQLLAESQGNTLDTLRPRLIHALVLSKRGLVSIAQEELLTIRTASNARLSIRWETEKALAELLASAGQATGAELWFRRAIATYREQRFSVVAIDLRLPFVENGAGIFDSYMEFLVRQGRQDEALQALDEGRAETLMERTESRATNHRTHRDPPHLSASLVARRRMAVILVYCLRPGNSYLWAVAPDHTDFQRLPGKETLAPLIERYQRAVLASQDLLVQQKETGYRLYHDLVEPARLTLAHRRKIYIIADGDLERLNFETLIASEKQPHYWIEDETVEVARSLGMLTTANDFSGNRQKNNLLLIGDPVYRVSEFPELPNAKEEITKVASRFAVNQRELLAGTAATPEGYTNGRPATFSYIHFVAHAVTSTSAPLDSAVVLSAPQGEPESYKLYARDILGTSLNADLVTISSCFGSGSQSYSGEGLVGLSWAFLHAGAHHVIAALWQVNDASTPQLMDSLYGKLTNGEAPSSALRDTKLEMLHSGGVYRKPFYWATFQVYAGK